MFNLHLQFTTEIFHILRNNFNEDLYKKIKNAITTLDKALYSTKNISTAYFSKIVKNLTVKNNLSKKNSNYYLSIENAIDINTPNFNNKQSKVQNDTIAKLFLTLRDEKKRNSFFSEIHPGFGEKSYFEWVNKGTDELYRQVLNVYISKIFGFYINDNVKVNRRTSKPIKYKELRTIVFVRNQSFRFNDFLQFIELFSKEVVDTTIDYSILDVIEYFVSFAKRGHYVDNLIQIHKFTNEMWKNGSKFLHFYTLHNQEHAIELIKSAINFMKNIDFIQIGKLDYYILFISCYLHDISMVLHPDLIKIFTDDKNSESNLIISNFKDRISDFVKDNASIYLVDSKSVKELLIDFYKEIDNFFECSIRNNHAYQSASFIKSNKQLHFIENTIRDIVAEISEAHAYDILDVYDVKSVAKDSLVSKKYLKILLRIADLLDVCDNRISNTLLLNNESHMSKVTLFHWLSHQAISGYNIETHYTNKYFNQTEGIETSYISKHAIEEKIVITFNLNIRHQIKADKAECLHCNLSSTNRTKNDIHLKINSNKELQCTNSICNFMCKWMVEKNQYLFVELYALQKYLSRAPNNFFITTFEVRFISSPDARLLNPSEIELLSKFI